MDLITKIIESISMTATRKSIAEPFSTQTPLPEMLQNRCQNIAPKQSVKQSEFPKTERIIIGSSRCYKVEKTHVLVQK